LALELSMQCGGRGIVHAPTASEIR
jgi:hypothetical protein